MRTVSRIFTNGFWWTFLLTTVSSWSQVVPPAINYQGFVEVDGVGFTGTGLFKFAIVDDGNNDFIQATATIHHTQDGPIIGASILLGGSGYVSPPSIAVEDPTGSGADLTAVVAGGSVVNIVVNNGGDHYTDPTLIIGPPPENVIYWNNEGTLAPVPSNAVEVPVMEGQFSVVLGRNMALLYPYIFNHSGLHLRQWFSDGVSGFVQLTNDIPLTSVPYAMIAASVEDGAIGAAQLAPGAVQAVHLNGNSLGDLNVTELSVGTDEPNNDDVIRFDDGEEFLAWLNFFDGFLFSNDLGAQGRITAEGDVYVGHGSADDDDTIFFDAGTQFLRWDESAGKFVFSGPVSLTDQKAIFEDLYLGTSNGDKSIYFFEDGDPEGEYLRWDDSRDSFVFSDSVEIDLGLVLSGGLFMDTEEGDQVINFYEDGNVSGESLMWNDVKDEFSFSDDLRVEGEEFLRGPLRLVDPGGDQFIYFTGGVVNGEHLRWNNTRSTFMLSDSLEVADDLFLGDQEGDHRLYFYDNGFLTGESFSWVDGEDRFAISDELVVEGGLTAEGHVQALGDLDVSGDGRFGGKVLATQIVALTKNFRIDHPLDPANRMLYHSSVESPDMKTFYDGLAVLDGRGTALVDLPSYFEALNMEYRYQLTAIGAPGPNLHISREIEKNQFEIAGGAPGLKVSWQVSGIRQDAYARDHRSPVEEDKPEEERGTYIYPEGFTNRLANLPGASSQL